jgi:hypothetical protein
MAIEPVSKAQRVPLGMFLIMARLFSNRIDAYDSSDPTGHVDK